MTKLRLGPILDDKPIRMTVEVPAELHRVLKLYAMAMAHENGGVAIDPSRLVAPMLDRFMKGDKAFLKTMKAKTPKDL